MKSLSIVIPVYNEEENIKALHDEICEVCVGKYNFEIIIADDGSKDNTGKIAKTLNPIKYIRLRKNFGQTAAMDIGIKNAKNDYIITMDGDRQNDPNDIPKLIEHLEKNDLDLVSGWRKNRKDSIMKRLVSRVANMLRKILIHDGIHDSGCSLKIYRRECFETLDLYGDMHRFIPAALKIKGFKIGEIIVNHRPRTAGKSKYNWERTFKGFIDMVSVWFWNKFAVRPLHLLGGMGLVLFIGGFFAAGMSAYIYWEFGKVSHTGWPLLSVFLFLTGILLFVLGLISDILIKTYYGLSKDKSYSVKEIYDNK